MMGIASLIGKPWALPCNPPQSYDCWELAILARELLGKSTEQFHIAPRDRSMDDRDGFDDPDPSVWKQLNGPQDGCLVGFGSPTKHCGVYIDRRVIHAYSSDGIEGAVQMNDLDVLERLLGEATFWEADDAKD